ncbi:uncharacterized protein [Solanum lycopersicum]|uniref:uncharacterized protein n=1 Tax=Solanum lycopersicum TaxID=4081 RepID=UPI0002BC9FC9|nr:uncharacterized protein LOC101245563 [Solanum lycopersicum]
MSVLEYGLKFTQLSRYALDMVKDIRGRMSLFVAGLVRASSKEGRAAKLIGDMDISRLMVYVQQVEEEKLRDREEYRNKKCLDNRKVVQIGHNFRSQRGMHHHLLVYLRPETEVITMNQIHRCRDGREGCFKCGQVGHFMREWHENSQGGENLGNRA